MKTVPQPSFRDLTPRECKRLLDNNGVGRIAYARKSVIDIEPIGYAHVGEWLFGRTSEGTKLQVLSHHPWVAFEVDEVDGPFSWRSVVIRGTFYRLYSDKSAIELATYRRALRAIRKRSPGALSTADPVPFRSVLFGIHIDSMTGRAASET